MLPLWDSKQLDVQLKLQLDVQVLHLVTLAGRSAYHT